MKIFFYIAQVEEISKNSFLPKQASSRFITVNWIKENLFS